jgi:O-antigen/teichoic acid export membrane protein
MPISAEKLVVLSAWASRLIAAFAMIYSLRILSTTLLPGEYAMFIILVGLIGWFALSDGGIGYAVQNAVTKKLSTGQSADQEIVCAYSMLLLISTAIVGVLFGFREKIAELLFGKIASVTSELGAATFMQSAIVFVAGAAATLSTKILYSMHRGYVANTASAISAGVGVLFLIAGITSAVDKVAYAVLALYGPAALIGCALGAFQIFKALRSRPTLRITVATALLKSSKGFFVFYLLAAAVLQIDYLVMSQKVSESTEIIQYYSLAKVFTLISFFNQAILFAAWPQMTAQYTSGAFSEIKAMLCRMVIVSASITLLATFVILVVRSFLAGIIVPNTSIEFRPEIIAGFGALALMRCLTDPFAIFLQSIGRMSPLIVCVVMQALLGAGLQWYLSETLGIGGILLALVVAFAATAAWALPYSVNRTLTRTT